MIMLIYQDNKDTKQLKIKSQAPKAPRNHFWKVALSSSNTNPDLLRSLIVNWPLMLRWRLAFLSFWRRPCSPMSLRRLLQAWRTPLVVWHWWRPSIRCNISPIAWNSQYFDHLQLVLGNFILPKILRKATGVAQNLLYKVVSTVYQPANPFLFQAFSHKYIRGAKWRTLYLWVDRGIMGWM